MTRPLTEIEDELAETDERIKLLQARRTELRAERDRARVAEAADHPWAGKSVRRRVHGRTGKTERGTVVMAPATGRCFYRNHTPQAGEWFVRSSSGATAYSLATPHWRGSDPWELDE